MSTMNSFILIGAVMLIGLIATFWVGFSKANKEENSSYTSRTGSKWARLSLLYIVCVVIIVVVFVMLK